MRNYIIIIIIINIILVESYKNNEQHSDSMQPENNYVMDGSAMYSTLQSTATGNAVKPIADGLSWNMFQGATNSHDPKKDYRNFYKKYTLAYNEADNWPHTKGIPILSSSKASDAALLSARDTVIHMLTSTNTYQHQLLDAMLNAHARVTIKAVSENWDDHPEVPVGVESGGGSLKEPSTGVSEEALCFSGASHFKGRHELIEEFGHSIQEMAIISVDANMYQRIRKATKAACNTTVWNHKNAISENHWDEVTESDEYFASGVEFIFGDNPINPYHHAKTKQQLFDTDKNLYCLATAFYDVSNTWSPSKQCGGAAVSSVTASIECSKVLEDLDHANPLCASGMRAYPSIVLLILLIMSSCFIFVF